MNLRSIWRRPMWPLFGVFVLTLRNMLRKVIKHRLPFVIAEDGFIRSLSIGTGENGQPGLSCLMDHRGVYYDDALGSLIHHLLDSPWQMTGQEREKAQKAISFIVSNGLSKYNLMAPSTKVFNAQGRYESVCLLLDQRRGDQSVVYARANAFSFKRMLRDAVRENPKGLILIKIHPDAILTEHGGYFTDMLSYPKRDNIHILSENINPISLLKGRGQCLHGIIPDGI